MNRLYFLILCSLIMSCGHQTKSLEEIKKDFGDFQHQTIKTIPIDYTTTPVNEIIEEHPEKYKYLDDVLLYSIGHISDGLFIKGLLVKPKKEGKYPVIIYNRGGNRDLDLLLVSTAVDVMAPIAARGYIVVASNYRGNSVSEGHEEFGGIDVNDLRNLLTSLSEIPGADTSRIGLFGISRGGMMNYLILKDGQQSNIRAAVNIGGITDLQTTIQHHPQIEEVLSELVPFFEENKTIELQKRSAVYWTDQLPVNVPILILHSKNDEHVNYAQIPPFIDSLKKHGIPHKFISFENDKHGLRNHEEMVLKMTLDWFDKYVRDTVLFNEISIQENVKQ